MPQGLADNMCESSRGVFMCVCLKDRERERACTCVCVPMNVIRLFESDASLKSWIVLWRRDSWYLYSYCG